MKVQDAAQRKLDEAAKAYRRAYNHGYQLSELGEADEAQRTLDRANARYEQAKAEFRAFRFAEAAFAALAESDGFSLDQYGRDPIGIKRYRVSLAGTEQVFPVTPTVLQMSEFFCENEEILCDNRALFLGGWRDEDGKVYLDVSTSFDTRVTAEQVGRANGQVGIYDAGTGETIYL